MTAEHPVVGWERVKEAVAGALELDCAQRAAYLDQALNDAPELRARAQELIAQANRLGDFLEPLHEVPAQWIVAPWIAEPLVAHDPQDPPDGDGAPEEAPVPVGEQIGRYRILRVIAAGGAGTVYEAEQDHPRRTVALKLLHASAGSELARRFTRESELLARLRHPNIAHVYEAGVHGDGAWQVPYIAMELIADAQTIVAHAQANNLPVPERLRLFLEVCHAVHHGHQHGIVHRDLKPPNILVGADGRPKVIDFGVARVLEGERLATVQTSTGALIGTLPYMSPEQCGAQPDAIDVRTDVYALGVVLFELVSGRLPLAVVGMPLGDALRAIQLRPATRLRQVAPHAGADLDAITAKALHKDPVHRYASAVALAGDLQHLLEHRPVQARPPRPTYRASLFVRRHRALVAAAGVIFLSLAAATALSARFAWHAWHAAEAEAHQRRVAELTQGYLEDLLRAPSPHERGAGLTVLALLDAMVERLDREGVELPEVESAVRATIGETYLALGRTEPALAQLARAEVLERAPDAPSARRARVLAGLALALGLRGDYPQAETRLREAGALLVAQPAADSGELAAVRGSLADTLLQQGKLDEAHALNETIVRELRAADRARGIEFAGHLRRLARTHARLGRHDVHERLLREALARAEVPDDHPFVASSWIELAAIRAAAGDRAQARAFLARAWRLTAATRRAGSMDWNWNLRAYYDHLIEDDDRVTAHEVLSQALADLERQLGPNDYRTREARGLLAELTELPATRPRTTGSARPVP